MVEIDRRALLAGAGGAAALGAIGRALAIEPDRRTGTIRDVEHIVILMQENRGFDHYFGTMAGVRGFGDRFPIPVAGAPRQTVWAQQGEDGAVAPFHLDTLADYALMCAEGTPHTWPDAQAAWDEGRMSRWPQAKTVRAMAHYGADDIPFQFALADAFTICDAYHCSIQTGTNTNRLFLWSGTNDPAGVAGGPAIGNSHDSLVKDGGWPAGYRWTAYVERLQAAGIDWRIYQDMADNFSDNPLAGFARFRDALAAGPGGADWALAERGLSTHDLGRLRADVMAGRLPQVSYIVADAAGSEHPAASSPAQGADYTARVLDALTANPAVWARTVLLVMFDENDGYFDHMPPPAPPSRAGDEWAGGSTVPTDGEYHLHPAPGEAKAERPELIGRPYGLGPRVPMYVVSPWSRGGWVTSQLFDHTSVIRFIEARFGVAEPNISPWRRAVCGDLTSAFDFARPDRRGAALPATAADAARAKALPGRPRAAPGPGASAPIQAGGARRSRALPYAFDVDATIGADRVALMLANRGTSAAVLQVYDRLRLGNVPRRYTLSAGKRLRGDWAMAPDGGYDLWLLGPNGFHRHLIGDATSAGVTVALHENRAGQAVEIVAQHHDGHMTRTLHVAPMAYEQALPPRAISIGAGPTRASWSVAQTGGWYDLAVRIEGDARFFRRFAGRLETGRDSITDPATGGGALLRHLV